MQIDLFEALKKIENQIDESFSREKVFGLLRTLTLTEFGIVMFSLPLDDFPKISALLPRMSDNATQKNWTGAYGVVLLRQTLDFVRSLEHHYLKYTGCSLDASKILDYGVGYGRIARLIFYYVNESSFFGIDPWQLSLDKCIECGIEDNLFLSQSLSTVLPSPITSKKFDCIYAFSVFTHLSEEATIANLNLIQNSIENDGLIAITIRPKDYWMIDKAAQARGLEKVQMLKHDVQGFAFLEHPSESQEIACYGDTSMTVDWIEKNFPRLKIVGIDNSISDPYQRYIFLAKK